jgi:hypothetical protein
MQVTEMMEAIQAYHKKLGYDYQYESLEKQMEHFRSLVLAQMVEVVETVDWTPWKPWRDAKDQVFNKEEAALELVDQFFFLTAMWLSLGLPIPSFEDIFKVKLAENLSRIERGYNKTQPV